MKAAFFTIILLFSLGAKAQVRPWPLDNGPSGAPPQPTPAEIAAQQQALKAQQDAYNEQLRQQQELGGQGGRSEMANPMMGMPGMNPQSSNGNGIADGGRAGTGPNGMANSFIDGCTTEAGQFQFKMGTVNRGTVPGGCDARVQASDELVNFLSKHLNRCVRMGVEGKEINGGKIINSGVMGDAAHQQTGSLHNYGLAIDVNAIVVNVSGGQKVFNYSNKRDTASQSFFRRFRQCWTDAVQSEKAGCIGNTRSGMVGTIGEEDDRHHNHLHLSVPFCNNVRPSNAYITMLWFMSVADAAEAPKKEVKEDGPMPPPSTFTRKTIKVKGGELKLTVEDTHGEPVAADHIITVEPACTKKVKGLAPIRIDACDFTDISYDAKKHQLTLRYRSSDLVGGKISCRKPESATYSVPCE